ncbi:FMN-binding negative transcriptional regulator [Actinotalea ferrariae]|uniref:FMN-binding negative transcriptional regulator n=1 Tax=Actinotalea ferrariae TaxID=1386098 RepID=UPI001C8B3011|nr:FMN-binding negative transcriptional regulator [Actinotalea ferrariae]MBX9243318.1 FMN-binding negative transcriptional regulator [Actinotalea ferrariae]
MIRTPVYALTDEGRARRLVREHGWATLVSHTATGLVASHVPVLLEDDDEFTVVSHVGRPDDEQHELGEHEVLLVVEGPYGYVSPGWYGYEPAVPTWNYVAVHLYGTPELLGPEDTYRVLDATTDRYEDAMPAPVRLPDVAEYAARIAPGAAGFRLRVTRWEGRAKLSQDKPRAVVERVVAQLEAEPADHPYANPALAAEMRAELMRRPSRPGDGR